MAFDIRTSVLNGYGEYKEDAAERFHGELLERFSGSPEFGALTGRIGYARLLLEYAATYCGENLKDISPEVLNEVLFDIVPRKVSMQATEAPDMVAELRAFFAWLDREFALPHARACLEALDGSKAADLRAELADERNFGMAKSFFMKGRELGYDMTTQEGVGAFALVYNLVRAAANCVVPPRPSLAMDSMAGDFFPPSGPARSDRRNKRKQERKNRKKNRR